MTQPLYDDMLDRLQRDAFSYFMKEVNPANGLVKDCTRPGFPSSIAVVGLALAAYTLGVERGLVSRTEAVERTLSTLRFFWNSPQGIEPDATGYKGFYYHFLDMDNGPPTRPLMTLLTQVGRGLESRPPSTRLNAGTSRGRSSIG